MMEIKRSEVWLADLNPTIGREQAGVRPVLVLSSDHFNQGFADLIYAIPITSKKKNIRSHIEILPPEGGLSAASYVMCEAMRSISKARLIKRLGSISQVSVKRIEETLRILLDL